MPRAKCEHTDTGCKAGQHECYLLVDHEYRGKVHHHCKYCGELF